MKRLVPFFFPLGFLEFDNPDDIDVPYLWTFRYQSLVRFLNSLGCEVLVAHAGRPRLYEIDNEPLKVGSVKVSEEIKAGTAERLEYEIDEFHIEHVEVEAHREVIADSVELALRAVELARASDDDDRYGRAALALGLYRLRGAFSRHTGLKKRHPALQDYLRRFVEGDASSMGAWGSSQRYYIGEVG